MIESGVGRTERPELRQRRGESRPVAEADDGEVRKPRPLLALVDAELLEPQMEGVRHGRRPVFLVGEDEHPDAAGLAVAGYVEAGRSRCRGRLPKCSCDRRHLRRRPPPEEGERDVEVRPDDPPHASPLGKLAPSPLDEAVEDVVGKAQGAEEPEERMAFEATWRTHAPSCRL